MPAIVRYRGLLLTFLVLVLLFDIFAMTAWAIVGAFVWVVSFSFLGAVTLAAIRAVKDYKP